MMCPVPSIGLGPDDEQGAHMHRTPVQLRPACHTVVTPTAADGIVALAALRSRPSRKQPQVAWIVGPFDERL
jgi:hypothetical protein